MIWSAPTFCAGSPIKSGSRKSVLPGDTIRCVDAQALAAVVRKQSSSTQAAASKRTPNSEWLRDHDLTSGAPWSVKENPLGGIRNRFETKLAAVIFRAVHRS